MEGEAGGPLSQILLKTHGSQAVIPLKRRGASNEGYVDITPREGEDEKDIQVKEKAPVFPLLKKTNSGHYSLKRYGALKRGDFHNINKSTGMVTIVAMCTPIWHARG